MNAALWIASGEQYLKEAGRSAKSVQTHMPDLERILVTPDRGSFKGYDRVFKVEPPEHGGWFLNCVQWLAQVVRALPHEQIILLDTDTVLLDPVPELFVLLERFDLAATHAPGRATVSTVYNVPDCFPELHVGLLAFNNSTPVRYLLDDWYDQYEENYVGYQENDQGPLRDILWRNKRPLIYYVLPPEYCFRFQFGGFASTKIKVLHGRTSHNTLEELMRIADVVNAHPDSSRDWSPGYLQRVGSGVLK